MLSVGADGNDAGLAAATKFLFFANDVVEVVEVVADRFVGGVLGGLACCGCSCCGSFAEVWRVLTIENMCQEVRCEPKFACEQYSKLRKTSEN